MDNEESAEARKKRLNRERQQQYQTPQQRELRKNVDAQLHRNQRAQENQQQTESRQAADAQAHRHQRAQESQQDTAIRLDTVAQSMRVHRAQESQEETAMRLDTVAQSMRVHRAQESQEETAMRLDTVAQSMRVHRAQESQQQTESREAADAQAHRNQRSQESTQERQQRLLQLQEARELEQLAEMSQFITQVTQFNENEVSGHDCGPMNVICNFCKSKNFRDERPTDGKFTHCCQKGKVKLPKPLDSNGNELEYPAFLQDMLMNSTNPNRAKFRDQIRKINNAVSFASMGATIVDVPGRGPYVFKIHGQTYHQTSHLNPATQQTRQYAQLYVVDSTQALSVRQQHAANFNVPAPILDQIDRFFRENNRLAQTYQMMREIEQRENAAAVVANLPPPEITMMFRRDRHSDMRRFNDPTANEIAIVFVNPDGEPPFERDIRVYPKTPAGAQPFVQIKILSPNLDPMTYAVMYPYGEPRWQTNWQCESYQGAQLNRIRTNVSMLQYKVAQTAIRDEFSPILHCGKLTQQWIVDSYLQVEANNLNYIRFNQQKLRTELYQGLVDHIENVAAVQNVQAGVPLILPSTFSGSPRNMREICCDAMSIFAKHGAPDLFITFTANPHWDEIKENLCPGEQPSDRPDVVARVFKIKLDALIEDLTKNGVFGKCTAFIFTIEFQKRGLPHAHILITLRSEDKFLTAEKINRFVRAEIPSEQNPILRELVLKHMTHGPCGAQNPQSPCMEHGKCKKQFPKEFSNVTQPNNKGYPVYKRRQGVTAQVRGATMDNRFIVPFSPFLLLKYKAHINVEVCTSLNAIKYIYKYIFKGFDSSNITITSDGPQLNHDEVSNFISCRYVSAPEAMWRLRENKMHDRSHTVTRLPVHLPNQQRVIFEEGQEEEAVLAEQIRLTKLLSYFKLNEYDQEAQRLLYTDIPYDYIYEKNVWRPRKRGGNKVVSRMYTVSPRDEERFYLRTLLLHVRGAKSFKELRTVDGQTHPTFKTAAGAMGLLASDEEWVRCLQDSSTYQMPKQMRATFAYILCFASVGNPLALWEQFRDDFTLDYCRNHSDANAINLALHDIEQTLQQHRLSCALFNLPVPQGQPPDENTLYDIAQEAYDATMRMESFNAEQNAAFSEIRHPLDYPNDAQTTCFYLNGPGGSGKTYVYHALLAFVRGQDRIALAFATTGIAATLLKGGRTAHSGFKLPVPILETSVSSIRPNSKEAEVLKNAKLILIDEITMMPKDGLRIIDKLLREIMGNERPFGGKVIVVGGDFRQTLPVVPHGTQTAIVETCVKSSPLWKHFKQLKLSANMRCAGQQEHNEWLLKIGEGSIPRIRGLADPDFIEVPQHMIENENLVDSIFGANPGNFSDEELSRRVIVTTTNANALEMNREIIQRLPGQPYIFYSVDSVISEDPSDVMNYPQEFLHDQTPSGMPPHVLLLKKGVVIMLLRNLNPVKGLCNGTRLVVEYASRSTITARIISECNRGDIVIIPRIVLAPSDPNLPFILKRTQFPVIPAFCITINKSQGQTYNGGVGIDLQHPVFGHGQLYVAVSRSKDSTRIKIADSDEQGQLIKNDVRKFTRNAVFKEVFRM